MAARTSFEKVVLLHSMAARRKLTFVVQLIMILFSISTFHAQSQTGLPPPTGLICVSDCGTCPTICSPPPQIQSPPPPSPRHRPPPQSPFNFDFPPISSPLAPPPASYVTWGGSVPPPPPKDNSGIPPPPPRVYVYTNPSPAVGQRNYSYPYYYFYASNAAASHLQQGFFLLLFGFIIIILYWLA